MNTEKTTLYFYPVWLRFWHALNAIGIILLILTGISMQNGGKLILIPFEPSVNIHNISGILISVNYLLFFFGNIFTNNGKFYLIKPQGFLKRPIKQAFYYAWGMFKGMKKPYPLSEKRKFNPLQKYSYVIIMYICVPLVIISGVALLFPEIIIDQIYSISGITITAISHSILGFFISIFLVVHLYIATIGKSPVENYKSIITGWHEKE